jgi:hypothetical protein
MPNFGQSQTVFAEVTVPEDGSTWVGSDVIQFVAPPPPSGGGGGGGGGGNPGGGNGGGGGEQQGGGQGNEGSSSSGDPAGNPGGQQASTSTGQGGGAGSPGNGPKADHEPKDKGGKGGGGAGKANGAEPSAADFTTPQQVAGTGGSSPTAFTLPLSDGDAGLPLVIGIVALLLGGIGVALRIRSLRPVLVSAPPERGSVDATEPPRQWEVEARLQEISEDERGPRWEVEAELQEMVGEERARGNEPAFDPHLDELGDDVSPPFDEDFQRSLTEG